MEITLARRRGAKGEGSKQAIWEETESRRPEGAAPSLEKAGAAREAERRCGGGR